MNEPRDHHFVPQFLLARWCDEDGILHAYSRPHERIVIAKRAPRGTAYGRDLYAFELVPPQHRQAIERDFMSQIDDKAALVVDKLIRTGLPGLTEDERSNFTRFLLSLRARHPDSVQLARKEGHEAALRALTKDPHEWDAVRRPESPASMAEWVQQRYPHVVPNFGISMIPKIIVDPNVGERVFGFEWFTCDVTNSNTDFLISDRPCVLEGNAVNGLCTIALPLSPRVLFVAGNNPRVIAALSARTATQLVKHINRAIVFYAAQYVYGTGRHHLALIEKYLGRAKAEE